MADEPDEVPREPPTPNPHQSVAASQTEEPERREDDAWWRSTASEVWWQPSNWSWHWGYRTGSWEPNSSGRRESFATTVEYGTVGAAQSPESRNRPSEEPQGAGSAETGTDPWVTSDPWAEALQPSRAAGEGNTDWNRESWRPWDWSNYGWANHGWGSQDWWNSSSWSTSKPDYADPPTWPGWSHRRLWVQAIRRWDKQTDIPVHKRAEKLLRTFGWEMQVDFEHIPEATLCSNRYLDSIIEIVNSKAGVREDDDKRRAYKQAITNNMRHREESLAQYSLRRARDFQTAAGFGVEIPPALRAMLLKEGAGLSDQGQQNLIALVQGRDDDPEAVARALSRMDVRGDRLTAFEVSTNEADPSTFLANEEETSDAEDSMDEEEILKELAPLELKEDQICEVFAVLDQKRRSWKQNKLFKAEIKKDRGSFVKDGNQAAPRGQHGGVPGASHGRPGGRRSQRSKLSREQLKKVSKCRLCDKVGHWAEDCHQRPKAMPSGFSYCGDPGALGALTLVTYPTLEAEPVGTAPVTLPVGSSLTLETEPVGTAPVTLPVGSSFVSRGILQGVLQAVLSSDSKSSWTFLTLSGNEAILDIGATQDLIGARAMEALTSVLKEHGLQPITINKQPVTPSGIGGAAQVDRVMLVPISPGGVPGVLEVTVLKADIPPLLSVGFLEFLQASIDLPSNVIQLKRLGLTLPMKKLTSGHRTIPLVKWEGGIFPVPLEIQQKYGVSEGDFNLDDSVSCAYTKGAAAQFMSSATTSHGVEIQFNNDVLKDEPNQRQLQQEHNIAEDNNNSTSEHDGCAAVHLSRAVDDTSFQEGFKVKGKVEDTFVSHDMHAKRDHDADPQCPQQQVSSSDPMGLSHSLKNPQFDRVTPRHGTSQLSFELRDRHSKSNHPSLRQVESADAPHCVGMGSIQDELCLARQSRVGNQGLSQDSHEELGARRTCCGPMPPSNDQHHLSVQPICNLDSLHSVSGKDLISIPEDRTQYGQGQGKGKDIDSSRASCCGTRGRGLNLVHEFNTGQEASCPTRPEPRDPPASLASHEPSELSVRPADDSGAGISSGVGTRTKSDDHPDERGTCVTGHVSQHGSMVLPERDGESQRGAVKSKSWPAWMLATGAAASAMFLAWEQCSVEFQDRLKESGMSEETYLFHYELLESTGDDRGDVLNTAIGLLRLTCRSERRQSGLRLILRCRLVKLWSGLDPRLPPRQLDSLRLTCRSERHQSGLRWILRCRLVKFWSGLDPQLPLS